MRQLKPGVSMEITPLNDSQFVDYLALLDREIRPEGSGTLMRDDFPLILGSGNRGWAFGICEGDRVLSGAACLVRQLETSCGAVPVGGIGCVVTRSEARGQGFSSRIQSHLLARLAAADVPLAVLWTGRPEIYAGRGFRPAGWEFHGDLSPSGDAGTLPPGCTCRPYAEGDAEAVAALYDRHPLRTIRKPGDATLLYGMPGTTGLVAVGGGGEIVAAVFCGKGADFVQYVSEWSGPCGLVLPLLDEARGRGPARRVLVPAGGQALAVALARRGATVTARPAGCWAVTQPDQMSRYLQGCGLGTLADPADPVEVLGEVGPNGVVVPGALTVAVWGLDSV
jgi:GNAT superfamily N-acetyltransferase